MINLINYTAWFNIFALAMNLTNDPLLQENIVIQTRWGVVEDLNFSAKSDATALYIDIIDRRDEIRIGTYVLIPWQEMYSKTTSGAETDQFLLPEGYLYTVTPFAIIYQIPQHKETAEKTAIAEQLEEAVGRLFNFEQSETVIFSQDGFTSESGLQVMTLTEYPWYVEVHAALPGSQPHAGIEMVQEFPAKMVHLSLMPETGETKTFWYAPEESGFEPGLLQVEDELINLYSTAINMCMQDTKPENKQKVFDQSNADLQALLKKSDLSCDLIPEFCIELLERLLFCPPTFIPTADPENLFPDYTPKTSPDGILDFMPELEADILLLPSANIKNLPELVTLFKSFKSKARKEPGEKIEGNMVLGAKPEEYIPSRDELLLNEVGDRIEMVAADEGSEKVKEKLKQNNIGKRKFKYKKYSFIHMDVMGSGRYFYVDEIKKTILNLY